MPPFRTEGAMVPLVGICKYIYNYYSSLFHIKSMYDFTYEDFSISKKQIKVLLDISDETNSVFF